MHCCLEPQQQHYMVILLVQCCLESLGEHSTGFLSVQYCPRVFPTQEKHSSGKTLCSVVFEAPDNIA